MRTSAPGEFHEQSAGKLGGFSDRRHWVVIVRWLIVLDGLIAGQHWAGGEYVNNFTVPGSDSAAYLDTLNKAVAGLHTTLPIPAYLPMLVLAIVFGLSMDYEEFLLSRVHEAWAQTRDSHRSVAIGIRMILVTSGMSLLGAHAWWMPGWQEPVLPARAHPGRAADRRLIPACPGLNPARGRACQ